MKSIRQHPFHYKPRLTLIRICLLLVFISCSYSLTYAQSNAWELTVAVLINSSNSVGYNPDPAAPGEFQRYPERYLEHLQIPYDLLDVSKPDPPDLSNRQLIIAGHRGLNLAPAWQQAVLSAWRNGAGFLNLDSDPDIGLAAHIQTIFSTTGSARGAPGTRIVVPYDVGPDGSNPHYIAALQRHFLYDADARDFVYNFHPDAQGVVNPVTATVLRDAPGVVVAQLGWDRDPLILARDPVGRSGRAVHFGTYDYLKADRFGFLMGVDDLFWRSVVWAARKPFVLRGYPRLWAVQMDDTLNDWGYRVKDLYDPALTGGNPWKVTGYIYYRVLIPGNPERASVIADIKAGRLEVSPHSMTNFNGGDFYFQGTRPNTDAEWAGKVKDFLSWKQGRGGADTIPFTSRSMVPHWYDLSDNTGSDMWNVLGIRYVTTKQWPGFYVQSFNEKARLNSRPFWVYERPPRVKYVGEDYPMFFADDYTVNSQSGQPPQTFFLFLTNVIDRVRYQRFRCNYFDDIRWPNPGYPCGDAAFTAADSADMFKWATWRLWSSMAPVELFNHDAGSYSLAKVAERRFVIQDVSAWLNGNGVEHIFMQNLGDYLYARTKSVLRRAGCSGGDITYTFTGNSATADGDLIPTRLYVFTDDLPEGGFTSIPGFKDGLTITLPAPTSGRDPSNKW